jgi:hypothetical protein
MQRGRNVLLSILAGAVLFAGWSGRPALADPPAVEATGLPAGWEAAALGTDDTLAEKQTVTVADGKWTVVASGKDLQNDADGGLIVYQKHTGNGSVSFRLLSQTGGEEAGWVKTAVAFRESTAPGSRTVWSSYTSGNKIEPMVRLTDDTAPVGFGEAQSIGFSGPGNDNTPAAGRDIGSGIWLGMERNGNDFNAFYSNDGKIWTRIGGATVQFPEEMLAGIAATAHKTDPTDTSIPPATNQIDNVSVSNELLSPRSIQNVTYLPRDKSVLVTWTPVSVADGDVTYNVYEINANATETKKLNAEPLKTSSYLVEGLTNGQAYRYAVTATLNGVESGMQFPEPNSNGQSGFRAIGVAVPGPAILGGLQLYHVGTIDVATVSVTGEGDAAKLNFHAGGTNIWNSGDGAAFLAMPIEGDFDVSAQFVSGPTEAEGGGWEHGGIMARESLDPGARFAYAQLATSNQLQFKRRRARYELPTNSDTSRDDNTARPISMRLTRTGDTFQSFYSEDNGATWKDIGDPSNTELAGTNKDTIPGFAKTAWVGITLVAHEQGSELYTDAVIDNIKFVGKAVPPAP